MAHYTITHTCGHDERVSLVGKHSYREWRIQQLEAQDCTECFKAAQAEAARQETVKRALPPLTGSEAQIAWALSIRLKLLDAARQRIMEQATRLTTDHDPDLDEEQRARRLQFLSETLAWLERQTNAHWWIDHRDESLTFLLAGAAKQLVAERPDLDPRPRAPQHTASDAPDALQPATPPMPVLSPPTPAPTPLIVRPASTPVTESIVLLRYDPASNRISASMPEYQEAFRQTMRAQEYEWSSGACAWLRALPATAGDWRDRLAELAHTLIDAGFVVRLYDTDAYDRAVSGSFEPEQRRWVRAIVTGEHTGWLALVWPHGQDAIYQAANKLRGARYRDGRMLVPPGSAEEIEEFAQLYAFSFSDKARSILDEIRESQAHGAVIAAPKRPRRKQQPSEQEREQGIPTGAVPPVLPVPAIVEIADALRDHD